MTGEKMRFLLQNKFGLAILACAVVSFSFSAAFTSWGGVKLTNCFTSNTGDIGVLEVTEGRKPGLMLLLR